MSNATCFMSTLAMDVHCCQPQIPTSKLCVRGKDGRPSTACLRPEIRCPTMYACQVYRNGDFRIGEGSGMLRSGGIGCRLCVFRKNLTLKPKLLPVSSVTHSLNSQTNSRVNLAIVLAEIVVMHLYSRLGSAIRAAAGESDNLGEKAMNELDILRLDGKKNAVDGKKRCLVDVFQGISMLFNHCSVREVYGQPLLQQGGLGLALGLLSVTLTGPAAAQFHFKDAVANLRANPTFMSALIAWSLAQGLKVFTKYAVERKFDLKMLFASGGMPSSHSALVIALTVSVAIIHGFAGPLFPVCLGFSLIVMYDATGVRYHAGMQAEVLNVIVADLFQNHPVSEKKLKEILGHTPSQVGVGALLGGAVAYLYSNSSWAVIGP